MQWTTYASRLPWSKWPRYLRTKLHCACTANSHHPDILRHIVWQYIFSYSSPADSWHFQEALTDLTIAVYCHMPPDTFDTWLERPLHFPEMGPRQIWQRLHCSCSYSLNFLISRLVNQIRAMALALGCGALHSPSWWPDWTAPSPQPPCLLLLNLNYDCYGPVLVVARSEISRPEFKRLCSQWRSPLEITTNWTNRIMPAIDQSYVGSIV